MAKICDTRLVFYIRSLLTHPLCHIVSGNDDYGSLEIRNN